MWYYINAYNYVVLVYNIVFLLYNFYVVNMKKFLKVNKYYLLTIILMLLTFIQVKRYFSYELLTFDMFIHDYILDNLVNNGLTIFFKIITNMGSVYFYITTLIILFVVYKNKKNIIKLSCSLSTVYLINLIIKFIINRERPLTSLINVPWDPSFPSGHTACSIVFYGILIYLLNNSDIKGLKKVLFTIFLVIIIILIGVSRLYLGVHYLSDVCAGYLVGLIVLFMFINYFKKENI